VTGVSVVIPVYDRPELLAEAVASVLAQTIAPLEIVVVDDGSSVPVDATTLAEAARVIPSCGWTAQGRIGRYAAAPHADGFAATAPVSSGLASADAPVPELIVVRLPPSGFPGKARNAGVEAARGGLIAFLDSDDLWMPARLERQLAFLEANPGTRLVHTRELWLREGREVSQSGQVHARSGDVFADSLRKCVIGPSTVLVEKSLLAELGGFREDIEVAEDYELWIRLAAREKVGYVDEKLVVKRAGDWDQLSEKYGMIEGFRIAALEAIVSSTALPPGRMEAARAELSRKYRVFAAGARKRGREAEAADLEGKADALEAR
jgi:glycosyltransferase involved in cell wall biosynthesis